MRRRSLAPGPHFTLVLVFGLGCSYSIVADGEFRHDSFDSIVRTVEITRGVRARRPIDARIVTQDEMRAVIAEVVKSERDPEDLAAYEYGLTTVGLWPPDRPLVEEYLGVMGEEVAGLYVPEQSALFVVSHTSVPFSVWLASVLARRDLAAEFVLSHELVHLLQHQEHPELFDSDALLDQDDAAIALQAAFEGEAMFYGMLSMGGPLPQPEVMDDAFALAPIDAPIDESGALANAPALLRGLIGFPYVQGYRLAWEGAAELLHDPPASTEQATWQSQRHAAFEVFDLWEVSESLPEGCEAVYENTMGELQLSILFEDLSDAPVDESAWEGWDGDRYLAVRCHGVAALLWLTSWDSEEDAREFAVAYRQIAPAVARRAGLAQPPLVSVQGHLVVVRSPELSALDDALESLVKRARVRSLAELREVFQTR